MNKEMNEEFMKKWKYLFKTPFLAAGNGKQKDAFLKLYNDEQETFLRSLTAFQGYLKSSKPNGNAGDIVKLWQQHLECTSTLASALDSCRQSQREALFSFFKALTAEFPMKANAGKKYQQAYAHTLRKLTTMPTNLAKE